MNDTGRTVLIEVLVIVALPLLWGGMMMGGMGPWMMGGWHGDGRWEPWRFLVGLIPMVVILGGLAAFLLWALGRTQSTPPGSGEPTARDLLDARYARGEITREQYQQMREDISS